MILFHNCLRLKLIQRTNYSVTRPKIIIGKCGRAINVSDYVNSRSVYVNALTENGCIGESIGRTFNFNKYSDKWYLNKGRQIKLPNKHNEYIIRYECRKAIDYHSELGYICDFVNLENESFRCPPKGSFVGYKIASIPNRHVIIKLRIPEEAKRSSATSVYGAKCRCDKAKVIDIFDINNRSKKYDKAMSMYDNCFIYKVGEDVSVDDFCEDKSEECAPGIHFFMSSFEAIAYINT